jgi:hypothetical protein
MVEETNTNDEMTDEQALMKIAQAMKDNTPTQDEKQNVHTFLVKVVEEKDTLNIAKLGNLRDDKDINELGVPAWNVRGALEMARISDKIMGNTFFKDFFEASANETNITSLSREGFLIKSAVTQTRKIEDTTKRKKINKGWFGKKTEESSGGDTISSQQN